MNGKKKGAVLLLLLVPVCIIRLFSANPNWVENYYSTGIYRYISLALKYLFGWLPFSIGDLFYLALIIWTLVKIFRGVRRLFSKKSNPVNLGNKAYSTTVSLLLIYIVFNIFWGINYNRKGITHQLGITIEKYNTAQLINIDSILLNKVNESKTALVRKAAGYPSSSQLFEVSRQAYAEVAKQFPFLAYHPSSVKISLWGWAGNYIGFTGYYNPFSGEAQVNTSVPRFLQPYTSCHEIAHQLGYAKENEANFVGYLAAAASTDTLLNYSVYLDLFLYTQRNLFDADSASTKRFSSQLLPQVKADLLEWKKFNKAHRSPIEPLFKLIYGQYLERNQQPSGILSYDEVTGFLIAYYKKYGKL